MRQIDLDEVMGLRWNSDPAQFAQEMVALGGPAYAICLPDGVPAVIGGVTLVSPRVGSAWCVGTQDWARVAIETTRVARKLMRSLMAHDCHRIQALSADFHTQSHAWLRGIGFQYESTMKKIGKHGSDYLMFAMVR